MRHQAFGSRLPLNLRDIPRGAVLQLLRAYKYAISPLLPPACRYVPTCSEYAAEAVERHGAMHGTLMAMWRLLRCHPLAKGGFDPVPSARDRDSEGLMSPPIHGVFADTNVRATRSVLNH